MRLISCSDGGACSPPPCACSPVDSTLRSPGTTSTSFTTTAISSSLRGFLPQRRNGATKIRESFSTADRDAGAGVHIQQLPWLEQAWVFDTIRRRNVLPVVAFPLTVGHALHRFPLRRRRQRSSALRLRCPWSSSGPERELRDLLLRQVDRNTRTQRPPVTRKELERLLHRLHDSVELKRSPDEPHCRRNKLVALGFRRDEVRDLRRQLSNVLLLLLLRRHRRADVKPQLQRQLCRSRADELPRGRTLLISGARRRRDLVRKAYLQRLRIELHLALLAGVDFVRKLGVEFSKLRFFQFL